MKPFALLCVAAALASPVIERGTGPPRSPDRQSIDRQQVLGCMGPPANKATDDLREVGHWSYPSGNDYRSTFAIADATTNVNAIRFGNSMPGRPRRRQPQPPPLFRQADLARSARDNITPNHRVNHQAPTGELISAGERCAFAVPQLSARALTIRRTTSACPRRGNIAKRRRS